MHPMSRREDAGPSVPGLISFIQTAAEKEKAVLARELHDELGGLLVAASMDLSWLDHQLPTLPPGDRELRRRLDRLKEALAAAVDIKRKIIEELRPTLLDNVGLLAALRWLVHNTSARTGLAIEMRAPEIEPHFDPQASITLFRVAQEGMGVIMESKWVGSLTLTLGSTDREVTLSIIGRGQEPASPAASESDSYELAAIRHRMSAVGGRVVYAAERPAQVSLSACLPLRRAVRQ